MTADLPVDTNIKLKIFVYKPLPYPLPEKGIVH